MTEHASHHHRRSIRLPLFDYAGNATYFITICTANRQPLFGNIVDGQMRLNTLGMIVAEEWQSSTDIRSELDLHHSVVMPNHIHGLLTITPDQHHTDRPATPARSRPSRSLGSLVAGFKSAVTRRINAERDTPDSPVWQRNYHEHIVRNEIAFNGIWDYIEHNPIRWHEDGENPDSPNFRSVAPH